MSRVEVDGSPGHKGLSKAAESWLDSPDIVPSVKPGTLEPIPNPPTPVVIKST